MTEVVVFFQETKCAGKGFRTMTRDRRQTPCRQVESMFAVKKRSWTGVRLTNLWCCRTQHLLFSDGKDTWRGSEDMPERTSYTRKLHVILLMLGVRPRLYLLQISMLSQAHMAEQYVGSDGLIKHFGLNQQ